jgi:2-polyprenyl-3-methyl-5-hydroxy-6-metoxy-1,4-benzoquinol methylase
MPLRIDPQLNELRALRTLGGWRGLQVLEIGCGDGRLTRRLARLGASVHAIDPDQQLIRAARRSVPPSFAPRMKVAVGQAEALRFPAAAFNRVVFSWVL